MATLTAVGSLSRNRICSNRRAFFYKWGFRAMIVLIILVAINIGLLVQGIFNNQKVVRAQQIIEQNAINNRR